MQQTGYIIIDNIKYLLLCRNGRFGNYIKLRKSGKTGTRLTDEENHVIENKSLLDQLLLGKSIYL